MDPALYYRIYGEEVDEQTILRYNKPVKFYKLYHLITDHIQGN